MFAELRNNTKMLIWVVVIAFVGLIFLAWGADFQLGRQAGGGVAAPGEAGKVDGEPISMLDYQRLVATTVQSRSQQTGQAPDAQAQVAIQDQVWQSLVQETALRKEARKREIQATDPEVVYAVMNQPPAELAQLPQFQTDGQFDLAKYQALLRSPSFDTIALEAQFRRNLPLEKLQQRIMGTAVVSENELWNRYRMQNEKVKISYVLVPSGNFTVNEAGIDQTDIEAYYEAHKDNYKIAPQAKINYVLFPKRHSVTDSLEAYNLIAGLLDDFKSDRSTMEDIMAYSEAPPTQKGGTTATFISPTILKPQVRAVVAGLPVGQVSDVIIEPSGFHVVRVEEEREDETAGKQIKISDLYVPLRASQASLQAAFDAARQFRLDTGPGELAAKAEENGLTLSSTPPFTRGAFIPGVGPSAQVMQFSFTADVGDVSVPVERPGDFLIAELVDRTDERIQDLAEVADRVRRETATQKRLDQAKAAAERLLGRIRAGEEMQAVAESDSLASFETVEDITRLGFSRGVGNDPEILGPVFASEAGLIDRVLSAARGAFIIRVDEKTPADRAEFDSQKSALREQVASQKQGQAISSWVQAVTEGATVQDYRTGVF